MKSSKFSEAQIAFVLKQAEDGAAIAEVCRKAGIKDICETRVRYRYRRVHVALHVTAGLLTSGASIVSTKS